MRKLFTVLEEGQLGIFESPTGTVRMEREREAIITIIILLLSCVVNILYRCNSLCRKIIVRGSGSIDKLVIN